MNPLDPTGQTYKNFRFTKIFHLPELQSDLIELIHEPTGARIMHIANDDPENLFCLAFQTLPINSNGAPHVLEHTVLCGSQKFPIKDPFFSMSRRSLNTFMNALTGQDFTCYPASTLVEKDFYNLLEVYLDAVFDPLLKKLSFLQEGHRLEFTPPQDIHGTLRNQGIVFNEMKGAMASVDSRLWHHIMEHLVPDLPYAHNSGGDPKEIVNLTYEDLLDFHRIFYHPSRCLFFFYGNLPLAKHLDFIEEKALKKPEKLAPLPPIPLQPRFSKPIEKVNFYPIHVDEHIEDQCQIAFCFLTAHLAWQSDILALSLLEILLLDTDASPLKMALLQSGMCSEVESLLDTEMSEIPFIIVCKGCNQKNTQKLKKFIFKTLSSFISKPIDPFLIDAAIQQLEFDRTEIHGGSDPYGLNLFFRSGLIKLHGIAPEEGLKIHFLFEDLRKKLLDKNYLPSIIRKYILENPHFLTQILLPDPELEKKEVEEEKQALAKLHLTEEKKKAILKDSLDLLKFQEEIETQSLECLPTVTLKDIPAKTMDFPLSHLKVDEVDIYFHSCFTNKIIYAELVFELPEMEIEDFSLLSLLAHLWTEIGSQKKSYQEMLHQVQRFTGGISAHITTHVSSKNHKELLPTIGIRGKALHRNAPLFFQLLYEIATEPDFTNEARIREWLLQHVTDLEENLTNLALKFATGLSLAGFTLASYFQNEGKGLPYYQFIKKIVSEELAPYLLRMQTLAKSIIHSQKPVLVISASKEMVEELKISNFYFPKKWPILESKNPWNNNLSFEKSSSQIRLFNSPVAFTVQGIQTSSFETGSVAELLLSTYLLDNLVLHKEIREKGGAYGSGASYSPLTGNYHLYSFRDPNLNKTFHSFEKAILAISKGEFSEKDLEEAKIGLIASLDTPVAPGNRAIIAYGWKMTGRSLSDRQKLRDQILHADKQSIQTAISQYLLNQPSIYVSFLGDLLLEKEKKNLEISFEIKDLLTRP